MGEIVCTPRHPWWQFDCFLGGYAVMDRNCTRFNQFQWNINTFLFRFSKTTPRFVSTVSIVSVMPK
jgi:hypothetical protein